MKRICKAALILLAIGSSVAIAAAQEFGQGPRRELLEIQTTDLPQGMARVGGGERLIPPGGRSPWHTSGPKLLYVVDGTLVAEGLAGTLMSCGPAPKLCLFSPHKSLWFFRNTGRAPLKFVLIGIDGMERPTIHEEIGQITGISGDRVTLAMGDLRSSDLAMPRREVSITVSDLGSVGVGDSVVTVRYNEKAHRAEGLVKLGRRWE